MTAISAASRRHRQLGRFDMPGFRPNDHYILQMQRYGILQSHLADTAPIDCYATDRAYWQKTVQAR